MKKGLRLKPTIRNSIDFKTGEGAALNDSSVTDGLGDSNLPSLTKPTLISMK
jgi:hypothetical protein